MYDIEKEFNSYLIYMAEIENCKIEIAAIKNDFDINNICYEERTSSTNKTSNPTQDKFLNREKEYCDYEHKMKEAQRKVDKMNNAIRILSELEKEVIELNYFHSPKLSKRQIQNKIFLSSVSVYRIRRRALQKMRVCFMVR